MCGPPSGIRSRRNARRLETSPVPLLIATQPSRTGSRRTSIVCTPPATATKHDFTGAAESRACWSLVFAGAMTPPGRRDQPLPVVALVCSLGGADALLRVLAPLPASLPAAVVALQHLDPRHATDLPKRLDRSTALRVRLAVDGGRLEEGVVDVAPPGRHVLLAGDDTLLLVNSGPRAVPRPSADLLLVSMAAVLGPRLLAVVLTGTGDDGAVGAQVVTRYGGRTLVQDEQSSQAYGMPAATVASDSPGPPVPLDHLADVILRAVTSPVPVTEPPPRT